MIIAPSILALDFAYLREQLTLVHQSEATWLHVDVMDGHFVPNLSFGPAIVKSVRDHSQLFLDVHIMVSHPQTYADVFIQAGANQITFHVEACTSQKDVSDLIEHIHAQNIKVGITLKPNTPIAAIKPYMPLVDTILVMSVHPGFGGQVFIPEALDRIREIKTWITESQRKIHLQVDGGINLDTGVACAQAGCDVLVAGSYVFKGDVISNIHELWEKSQL